VNEAFDAYKINSTWIKSTTKGQQSVYIIGEDGKVRLEDIDVAFKTADATIFTGYMEAGTPMIDNEKRNILARTFRSMPVKRIEWQQFKEISWKDYVKYIVF